MSITTTETTIHNVTLVAASQIQKQTLKDGRVYFTKDLLIGNDRDQQVAFTLFSEDREGLILSRI